MVGLIAAEAAGVEAAGDGVAELAGAGVVGAAKDAGFQGIEMSSPGMNVEETKAAIKQSGLPVDGTVCSSHWGIRHTSAKAEERATALEHLKQAIRDTKSVGGNTVLLVIGKGSDGPENEIWQRSIENISKALPLASELGMYIAIENVLPFLGRHFLLTRYCFIVIFMYLWSCFIVTILFFVAAAVTATTPTIS